MCIGKVLEFKEPTQYDIDNNLSNYNWDVTLGDNHKPMRVCSIDGCLHTIGGRYGNNCLYMYPRDEKPTLENIEPFNGEVVWSYTVTQTNRYRKDDVRCCNKCKIFKAGQQVYEFNCGWELMPHKIMMYIEELKELPIYIFEIDYEEKYVLGRKIKFKEKPATIVQYMKKRGYVLINFEDGSEPVFDDILSKSIGWFRD